jgi:hypothetical protein
MNCDKTDHDDLPTDEEYLETSWLKCKAGEFSCGSDPVNFKCISMAQVCDNETDCPNGSDEGGMCGECAQHGCSHECQDYPDGMLPYGVKLACASLEVFLLFRPSMQVSS